MKTLINELREMAFPARDISDNMNMGEAVRLDQIEEVIAKHNESQQVEWDEILYAIKDAIDAYGKDNSKTGYCYSSNEAAATAMQVIRPYLRSTPAQKPDEVVEKIDKALEMVSALCNRSRDWVMSIPARPDYDPDLVIADALHSAKAAINER